MIFLKLFWTDQGNNVGSQYRSGIYYYNPEQEKLARESLEHIGRSWAKPNETFALVPKIYIYIGPQICKKKILGLEIIEIFIKSSKVP